MSQPPLLWLVIGPNGAGKSSFYDHRIAPVLVAEFVNADRLALARFGTMAPERSYEAARLATERRLQLLNERRSMVFETVFSHPSKLDFAQAAVRVGYELRVSFLNLDSADRCVERVDRRVRRGGHPVPEDRIRQRYQRLQGLARQAVLLAGRGWVYDNSDSLRPFREVLSFTCGRESWRGADVPRWATQLFDEDAP